MKKVKLSAENISLYLIKSIILIWLFLICVEKVKAETVDSVIPTNPQNSYNDIYFGIEENSELVGKTFADDVYVVAGTSKWDGVAQRDVLLIVGDGEINGIIEQDLRVMGGNVRINAQVMGNVLVIGDKVEVSDKAIFYKNVNIAANEASLNGEVLGKGRVISYKTHLNSSIPADWEIKTQNLTLGEEFGGEGNLTYYAPVEIVEASKSARIKYVKSDLASSLNSQLSKGGKIVDYLAFFMRLTMVVNLLLSLVLGYLLMRFFPRKFGRLSRLDTLYNRKVVKSGLWILVWGWIVCIGLIFSGIGIMAGLLLACILFSLGFLGRLVGSFLMGEKLLLKLNLKRRRGYALLFGLTLGLFFSILPIAGWVYDLMIKSWGLGVLMESEKDREETNL